jgi:hypothetical protein
MASPFQKYQSEQVQQLAPGFVEAYGRAGASIGQGIATIGAGVGEYFKQAKEDAKKEAELKGALAPYIKNDQRTKAVDNWLSEGKFVKADDGTVVLSANMAGKVNMDEVNKNLAFYNSTGGDGSKLSGESLNRFASMYQGEQKYASEQAAKATAGVELDLKRAQIDELKSKVDERKANAGIYGSAIAGMGFGVAVPNVAEGAPTGESLGIYNQPTGLDKPTTSAATAEPVTAVPSVDNKPAGVADTAPLSPEPISSGQFAMSAKAAAAAPAAAKPAAMPAAPAAKATAPTAPTAPKPAAPAPAAAPATYDVPKEAARVSGQLQAIQAERDATRTKYSTDRDKTNVLITRSKQAQRLPANKVGIDLASAANSYNQNLLKAIDESEARDMKKLDDRESTVNREFANYQAAATAQRTAAENAVTAARQAKQDARNAEADRLAKEAAARAGREETAKGEEAVRTAVSEYPIKGPWVHIGYDLKDKAGNKVNPARFGIAPLSTAQQNTVAETYDGWLKGTDFLIRLDDTLKSRVAGNNDYTQRFRLLASDMQNYFEGELASTFGVATFRRAIVSGGNFSDADREFVKKAITYLNTAAPDLDASDLEANTRALAVFIDNMYRKGLEGQGMVYNPEQIKKQAADLRSIGAETQSAALEATVADSEKFYNRYGIRPGGRALTTPEEKAALLEARTTLWNALSKAGQAKGLEGSNPAKFQPKK